MWIQMLTLGHLHSSGGRRYQRAQNSTPQIMQNNFPNHNFAVSCPPQDCIIMQSIFRPASRREKLGEHSGGGRRDAGLKMLCIMQDEWRPITRRSSRVTLRIIWHRILRDIWHKKELVLVEAKVWEHAVECALFEAAKACLILLLTKGTPSKLLISGQVG